MKRVVILGSTGSIGTQALDVLGRYADYEFIALTANENIDLLEQQALKYHPPVVGVVDREKAEILRSRLPDDIRVISGKNALVELAALPEADIVLVSVVGISGLEATLAAVKAGKDVALANKETLVAGGSLVMEAARQSGSRILPVDSEHSAIFQCIQGSKGKDEIQKIILTASGGPFRGYDQEKLARVTVADALKHPRWDMGRKVTIDSATLMNKGLEVIEAQWLFDMNLDQIEVVIHPQSIIHSMVQYVDGSVLAQMAQPDMRLPILYAFTYPGRYSADLPTLDFSTLGNLTFEVPDLESFPSLQLAYEASRIGGTMPAVLNAANEEAVQMFISEAISFIDIPKVVERAMNHHTAVANPTLEDIFQADIETRNLLKKG